MSYNSDASKQWLFHVVVPSIVGEEWDYKTDKYHEVRVDKLEFDIEVWAAKERLARYCVQKAYPNAKVVRVQHQDVNTLASNPYIITM